jgi:hypothetical protein
MALNINAPNLSGLAALASGSSNLNLQNPGALGLQAVQMLQQQQIANRNAALERMRMQQTGELALRQQGLDRAQLEMQQNVANQRAQSEKAGMALDARKLGLLQQGQEAKLAQQQFNDDRQFGLDAAKAGMEQQNKQQDLMFKYQQEEMKKFMADKKEALQEKGAFYSYARTAMDKLESPEEKQQLKLEILKEAQDKGYATKEEAAIATKMPLSTFNSVLESKIINAGMAKQYKDMNPDKKDSKDGTMRITGPGGVVMEYSPLSPGAETEAQKSVMNKDEVVSQIEKLQKDYNRDYFTYANQAGAAVSAGAEKWKGTPVMEQGSELLASVLTGKSPKEREAFLAERKSYMNTLGQVFNAYRKEITGAGAGLDEIKRLEQDFANGNMSPSELKGALDQIVTKYKAESDRYKASLKEGIKVGSYKRQQLIDMGHPPEEVDKFLKSKGEL